MIPFKPTQPGAELDFLVVIALIGIAIKLVLFGLTSRWVRERAVPRAQLVDRRQR